MKKLLLVEIVFSWGYMVRPPFVSGGGSSLPYPPPTTLVGAIAYPYNKLFKPVEIEYTGGKAYSPATKLLEHISYATMAYLDIGAVETIDITRHYTYAYIRLEHKRHEERWAAIVGVGKTYFPRRAVIAYIVDNGIADTLYKVSWCISRIGSKEGIVSVRKAMLLDIELDTSGKKVWKTIYPTPRSIADCQENCDTAYFWRLCREAYTSLAGLLPRQYMEPYLVPEEYRGVYGGYMRVRVKGDACVVKTPYSPLILPREVIE